MDDDSRPPVASASRPLAAIPDDLLLRRLAEILTESRSAEAELVAHIAEVDERRLYAREAFPSMFAYCTEALHLSEGEAYLTNAETAGEEVTAGDSLRYSFRANADARRDGTSLRGGANSVRNG